MINVWGISFILGIWTGLCIVGGIMLGAEKQREFMRKE